jgi:hypothetical protein
VGRPGSVVVGGVIGNDPGHHSLGGDVPAELDGIDLPVGLWGAIAQLSL